MTKTRYKTLDKDNSTSFTHISVEINQSLACTRSPTCRKILSKPRSPKVPEHASPSPKEDATWTWMFYPTHVSAVGKKSEDGGICFVINVFFSYQPFRYPLDISDVFDSTCFFWTTSCRNFLEDIWFALGTKEKSMLPADTLDGRDPAAPRKYKTL